VKTAVGSALLLGLAALLVLNLIWLSQHHGTLAGVKVGAPAPALSLPLLDGGTTRLEGGRTTVVAFWATWCAPCREELPLLERAARRLPSVKFLAVNVEGGPVEETRPLVDGFVKKLGLTLPVALDDGQAAAQWRIDLIPQTFVVDGEGKVRRVLEGVSSERELDEALR
jgi:thiol-disulfide isomerase/thioredoxin